MRSIFLALVLFVTAASGADIQVYFSPRGGCTEAVVENLNKATNSVLVQALVDAHRRGVKVEVILDRSQRTEKYSSATFLVNEGVPTLIDAQHAFAHYAGRLTMPGGIG